MERHIGMWKDSKDDQSHVGELIIDGNHLEFYIRDVSWSGIWIIYGVDRQK